MIELAEAMGIQMVVTLGALLADVPHSRPVNVSAFASDEALVERLGLEPPTYEGPTGIVGVLHEACADAGMPSRVACGPRCRTTSRPRRTRRARWRSCAGSSPWSGSRSTRPSSRTRRPTTSARSRARSRCDPDVQAFVERLERTADEEEGRPDPSQLPSGDVLAREFQRFLRQRGRPALVDGRYLSAAGQAIR